MMGMAEIVEAANHIHPRFQGIDFASQGACSADKAIETLAKGGVEAFDEGGIDPAGALCFLNEGFDHCRATLHNASSERV